jgi:hypothetical protein
LNFLCGGRERGWWHTSCAAPGNMDGGETTARQSSAMTAKNGSRKPSRLSTGETIKEGSTGAVDKPSGVAGTRRSATCVLLRMTRVTCSDLTLRGMWQARVELTCRLGWLAGPGVVTREMVWQLSARPDPKQKKLEFKLFKLD